MKDINQLAEQFPEIIISVKASELATFGRELVARALAEGRKSSEERILSIAEVAKMLGKSERTIYRMGERGTLNIFKLEGVNGVRLSEVQRYIDTYSQPI